MSHFGQVQSTRVAGASQTTSHKQMWLGIVTLVLLGYFCMGRSFAYWGVAPWKVFIGEVVLGWFLISGPRAAKGRWPWIAMKSLPLRRFTNLLLCSLAFGMLQVLHGVLSGHPFLTAARDLALNYYPFYFFLGLWVGVQDQDFLLKFLRLAAWVNGLYGILFILVLSGIAWFFPGVPQDVTPVPIFGQPAFSAAILLGLLCFEGNLRRIWPLLLLNVVVLLGMMIRGEWLAFALGLLVWGWVTENLKKAALVGVMVVALIGLMYVTGFAIAGPQTRGGVISASDVIGRVVAPISPDLAADLTSEAQTYEDTAVWRTLWWTAIWNSVHESTSRALFGYGFGFRLGDLVPYLEDSATRTPHNVFFFVLGYTGWIGVLIFILFQAEIARLLWSVHRRSGQPFGIVFWAAMLVFSLFTAFFEAPYGAIPFYLLAGCACAPLFSVQKQRPAAVWKPMSAMRFRPPVAKAAR